MNQRYWNKGAKAVRTALTYLSGADAEKYHSIGSVYGYRMSKGQRDLQGFPRSPSGVERCLDMLVERNEAELAHASLGRSTSDLKIYRRKFKSKKKK